MVGSSKKMISGFSGDGPGQADPFAHTPRKGGRIAVRHVFVQTDLGQLFNRNGPRLFPLHAGAFDQAEGNIFPNRQGIEQGRRLEQHAEPGQNPFPLRPAQTHGLLAINADATPIGPQQAQNTFQHDRFSRTRSADDHHRFALGKRQVQPVQHHFRAKRLVQIREFQARRVVHCENFTVRNLLRKEGFGHEIVRNQNQN